MAKKMLDEKRLEKIVMSAQEEFWSVVAGELSEIKTGDFTPEQTIRFDRACVQAVKDWYKNNAR